VGNVASDVIGGGLMRQSFISEAKCCENIWGRMVSSGLLRRVALVRTDVSEEPGAYFIRVTRIG
jgi:hypothetical protein